MALQGNGAAGFPDIEYGECAQGDVASVHTYFNLMGGIRLGHRAFEVLEHFIASIMPTVVKTLTSKIFSLCGRLMMALCNLNLGDFSHKLDNGQVI